MTKKEALQILAVLKAAYPSSYNNMTKEEASGTVSIWAMHFANMPVEIVMMAIHKAIATNKFPPSIAEVNEKIKAVHWDAYYLAYTNMGDGLPEGERAKAIQIYEHTKQYSYGTVHEPKVSKMLSGGYLQIGGG